MQLWAVARGTGHVESMHQKLENAVNNKYGAGVEFVTAMLYSFSHRLNENISRRKREGWINAHHYDARLSSHVLKCEQHLFDTPAPGNFNVLDYESVPMLQMIVPPSQEQYQATLSSIRAGSGRSRGAESCQKHMEERYGSVCYPVKGRAEKRLFNELMSRYPASPSAWESFLQEWSGHVDSEAIYPKSREMLELHFRKWEKTSRRRSAMRTIQSGWGNFRLVLGMGRRGGMDPTTVEREDIPAPQGGSAGAPVLPSLLSQGRLFVLPFFALFRLLKNFLCLLFVPSCALFLTGAGKRRGHAGAPLSPKRQRRDGGGGQALAPRPPVGSKSALYYCPTTADKIVAGQQAVPAPACRRLPGQRGLQVKAKKDGVKTCTKCRESSSSFLANPRQCHGKNPASHWRCPHRIMDMLSSKTGEGADIASTFWKRAQVGPLLARQDSDLRPGIASLRRLASDGWLNDIVIDCYMDLTSKRSDIVALSTLWRQARGVDSLWSGYLKRLPVAKAPSKPSRNAYEGPDGIAHIPVHIGASHWALIVIDFSKLTAVIYDSLFRCGPGGGAQYTGARGQKKMVVLAECHREAFNSVMDGLTHGGRLGAESRNELERGLARADCPHQTDASSCGVFVLMFSLALAEGLDVAQFSMSLVGDARKMVAHELAARDGHIRCHQFLSSWRAGWLPSAATL